MKEFVHLHLHTEYSMLDGATRIDKLFQKCAELGMPAVAITDHGNMFGAVAFNKAAAKFSDKKVKPFDFVEKGLKYKVKPIFGCEFYVAEDMHEKRTESGKMPKFNHLVLLAKDDEGYRNLLKLVSKSFVEGYYYKPRIDYKLLERHTKGLVCLSACISGSIPRALLSGNREQAEYYVKYFKSLFGQDFYIELQDHGEQEQKMILPQMVALAAKYDVKVVATNDVHYINKEDAETQKVLQCISFRTTIDQRLGNEEEEYFSNQELYLKSYDEMYKQFAHLPQALEATLEIANKCNVEVLHKRKLEPRFMVTGDEATRLLREKTFKGLEAKYGQYNEKVRERAENELRVIEKMGFVEYYLIVWDFIYYAESQGIPVGPGRGSGVGSIVAYALGITKIDPIKHELLFERFLNEERVSAPDFDIDFCMDRRGEVIDYVINKYGEENVAQIATFGTLAPKNAIKDVARVYNFPFAEVNKITKAMPGLLKASIASILGLDGDGSHVLPELKSLYENEPEIKKILDMAMQVEGLPRQLGIHAAGVVICCDPISDHVALASSGDEITTQVNMTVCEELGLLKMDFLGLRTLTDIKKAVDLVKERTGKTIDFYNMEYNDPEVYRMIGEADTHAVFQLESAGMKRFMSNLKPENIEDIIAGISLFRPGPMKKIDEYVKNKRNPASVVYADKCLEPILKVTYGIIVYQEQVMRIVQDMAGFSLGHADNIRRIMSKKKTEEMDKEKVEFVAGSMERGVSMEVAQRIFGEIADFAEYAFNKSHAAAYAYLAYQTAYLKHYHLLEFMAAVLNNRIDKVDELSNYLNYLKEKGVTILCPDINASNLLYTVEELEQGNAIRIGLGAIKNVGLSIIKEIVQEREENGKYKSFFDFVERNIERSINRKLLESFIMAGVFDCFGYNRAQLMRVYDEALDRAAKDRSARLKGQFSMFDMMPELKEEIKIPNVMEFDAKYKFQKEKEVLGIYASGSPLDQCRSRLMQFEISSRDFNFVGGDESEDDESRVQDNQSVTIGGVLIAPKKKVTKSGRIIGEAKLEDLYGSVSLMCGGDRLNKLECWEEGALVTVRGSVSVREGEAPILWVREVQAWNSDEPKKRSERKICFLYSFSTEGDSFFQSICDICAAYMGNDEAFIKDLDSGKVLRFPHKVDICDQLLAELRGLLTEDGIKISG